MTNTFERTKMNSSVRLAGAGLATLWVAASLWQQWSWTNASFTAITCGQARFPTYATWTVLTTIVVVVVGAVFHLKIGVRPGHPERAGWVIALVGLGISLVIGILPLLFNLLLIASTQGLEEPPAEVTPFVDEFVVLAMFIALPLAGIASLLVARSQTALARMGSVTRSRLSFGIAAGLPVWALVAAYTGVAINCGASWIVR